MIRYSKRSIIILFLVYSSFFLQNAAASGRYTELSSGTTTTAPQVFIQVNATFLFKVIQDGKFDQTQSRLFEATAADFIGAHLYQDEESNTVKKTTILSQTLKKRPIATVKTKKSYISVLSVELEVNCDVPGLPSSSTAHLFVDSIQAVFVDFLAEFEDLVVMDDAVMSGEILSIDLVHTALQAANVLSKRETTGGPGPTSAPFTSVVLVDKTVNQNIYTAPLPSLPSSQRDSVHVLVAAIIGIALIFFGAAIMDFFLCRQGNHKDLWNDTSLDSTTTNVGMAPSCYSKSQDIPNKEALSYRVSSVVSIVVTNLLKWGRGSIPTICLIFLCALQTGTGNFEVIMKSLSYRQYQAWCVFRVPRIFHANAGPTLTEYEDCNSG